VKRVIREHVRDFVAIVILAVLGLITAGVILAQQDAPYPDWVPFLGGETFELHGEFTTSQAVSPGQGQTVNLAGVKVGDVTDVEISQGNAVVTMQVEERYRPLIRSDATMLLRPRTGLQDMTIDLDIGRRTGEPIDDGATIPVAQTDPNVMPDQILAALDADTRDYLVMLLAGGGEGLGGRGRELSAGLRRFEPLARDLARINRGLAQRRGSVRRAITTFRDLMEELGAADTRLAEFVTSSNEVMGAFANQEASLRASLRELPSALRETRGALASGERFARELAPASRELIPAARALRPALRRTQPFLRETLGPIRDQIRPFTRRTRTVVRHLTQASGPLAETTRGTASSLGELNRLFNALAYNPPGPREGFLFWLAWLNHNTNNIFLNQDAHGPLRRGLVIQSCSTARLAEGFTETRPILRTVQQVTNVPESEVICPLDPFPFVP
jgi:phospholipid/cholesterol/gamma-HCH transport system substrate-binding protein